MKLAELMDQVRLASGNTRDLLAIKQQLDDMGIRLENIYQELEMNSSHVDCHRDISSLGEHVQPHSHSFYELIYCCTCQDVQYLLGSQRYRLQPGDVILIPPGISHCPLLPDQMYRPYERIVMWINADVLQQFYQKWQELLPDVFQWRSPYLLRIGGTYWEAPIHEVFQRSCMESEKRHIGWEAALYGNTTLLVTYINRALSGDKRLASSEKNDLLDELLSYVEHHLQEKISIASAAHHLLVSESTVTQLCRKRLGTSFYHYVTKQRLMVAKMLSEQAVYSRIVEETGASTATISRVNRAYLYGAGGYTKILKKLDGSKE